MTMVMRAMMTTTSLSGPRCWELLRACVAPSSSPPVGDGGSGRGVDGGRKQAIVQQGRVLLENGKPRSLAADVQRMRRPAVFVLDRAHAGCQCACVIGPMRERACDDAPLVFQPAFDSGAGHFLPVQLAGPIDHALWTAATTMTVRALQQISVGRVSTPWCPERNVSAVSDGH